MRFRGGFGYQQAGGRFVSHHRVSDVRARCFPRPVTLIYVPPLETPAAYRVRLAATTLKPCEKFAEYRI